jgi:hypothetical protein
MASLPFPRLPIASPSPRKVITNLEVAFASFKELAEEASAVADVRATTQNATMVLVDCFNFVL